jgi:hypothetical protein
MTSSKSYDNACKKGGTSFESFHFIYDFFSNLQIHNVLAMILHPHYKGLGRQGESSFNCR